MQHVHLGRSGLKVSRLCLGTMNFGPITSEADSHSIMDKALEAGINFFDTANIYGGKPGEGWTEQIIGRWIAKGGGRRDKIVLATKVYNRMGEWPNESRLSAYHIRKACDESLRRLQTDRIDLYQFHHVDRESPWEEIWQAMEQLTQAGKIIYAGSSNFAGWHIAQAQAEAGKRHFLGLISEQCRYSLAHRMVEMEVLPACRGYGLGVIPWSPLAGGLLAGREKTDAGRRVSATKHDPQFFEKHKNQLDAYESLCRELGEKPADVALAWLLHNSVVTGPIIGPRTVGQLHGNLHSLDIKLNADAMKRLDQIWPGPGGEAPEAFAW